MNTPVEENIVALDSYVHLKNFLNNSSVSLSADENVLESLEKLLDQSRLMYDTLELIAQGKLSESKSNSIRVGEGYIMKTNKKYAKDIVDELNNG